MTTIRDTMDNGQWPTFVLNDKLAKLYFYSRSDSYNADVFLVIPEDQKEHIIMRDRCLHEPVDQIIEDFHTFCSDRGITVSKPS